MNNVISLMTKPFVIFLQFSLLLFPLFFHNSISPFCSSFTLSFSLSLHYWSFFSLTHSLTLFLSLLTLSLSTYLSPLLHTLPPSPSLPVATSFTHSMAFVTYFTWLWLWLRCLVTLIHLHIIGIIVLVSPLTTSSFFPHVSHSLLSVPFIPFLSFVLSLIFHLFHLIINIIIISYHC